MKFWKPYTNIKKFLKRFTILKIGPLHIRGHIILDHDRSGLFHNHPFHYISFLYRGEYSEIYLKDGHEVWIKHKAPALIIRSRNTFHKIRSISYIPCPHTLFFAFGNFGWKAFDLDAKDRNFELTQRAINGNIVWAKKEYNVWFIGHEDPKKALAETRHSIHQVNH